MQTGLLIGAVILLILVLMLASGRLKRIDLQVRDVKVSAEVAAKEAMAANKAVNNAPSGEPTLREVVVGLAQQVNHQGGVLKEQGDALTQQGLVLQAHVAGASEREEAQRTWRASIEAQLALITRCVVRDGGTS